MAVFRLATITLLLQLHSMFTFAMDYNNLADVKCGETMKQRTRIVGGEDAMPGEFPWLASIGLKAGHFCGGTVVNNRFVLTAAHCFCGRDGLKRASQLSVTLGDYHLKEKIEPENPAAVVTGVKRMIVHENFECGKYINDVTLLELATPIKWSDTIQPACLPLAADRSGSSVFSGESAVAAGWGWLGEDKATYKKAKILQKVRVNVLEDKTCDEWYASQGRLTRVKHGQMCAGHEAGLRDSCSADSGGPLMFNGNGDRTMVIGIVSSGIGCARKRLPGIYTRVSEFMPWIIENAK